MITGLRSLRVPAWADLLGLGGALLALVVYFSLTTDNFFTTGNFSTIANQIPAELIIAAGMTFVLIAGGIDLSVGSVLAVSSAVFGVALAGWGWSLPMALLAGLGTGALCGAVNASIIAWLGIPSFIVTLGMLEAARGATYLVTNSQSQYLGQQVEWIATASFLGITLPIVAALLVIAAGQFTLSYTPFGRHLLAMGQSEEVAWLSGIPTRRIRWIVFCLAGTLTGLAALFHTARLSTADPNAGIGLELNAIAAVVIGGTSLSGGRGSVFRSAIGVVIIAVLGSGLAQAGAQEPLKRVVTGAVIVIAVILDKLRQKAER
jgi:ribose transport system permease protein